MTLTMMKQTYGVQVGNETYSVVVTDEDWEKRKLERDRQKRLSQETNRRRKALEERKKVAEEREARKRALQLSKRRQRQTEATERYQRAHLPSKPTSGKARPFSGQKKTPALDDVLQQLRSGSTEINYVTGNDEQNYTSAQQTNYSRVKFESKLRQEQQRLLQEHRQTTQKEFYNEIIEPISTTDPNNNAPSYNSRNQDVVERRHSYGQIFSNNIDLMSGQTTGSYHTLSDYPSNREYLPENVAKLFVKNDENNTPHHSRDIDFNQLHLEDADDVIQTPTSDLEKQSFHKIMKEDAQHEASFQDDQDSLHGSSSSGTSPISLMTSFHRKYADDDDYVPKPKVQSSSSIPNNIYVSSQATKLHSATPPQTPVFSQTSSQLQQVPNSTIKVASPATYPTWTHQYVSTPPQSYQEALVQSSYATTMASNYYLKSFRPSSAVENKSDSLVSDDTVTRSRPKSAIVKQTSSANSSANKMAQEAMEDIKLSKHSETTISGRIATSLAKPSATPFSVLYSDAWKKPDQSSPIFTQPEIASQSSSVFQTSQKPLTTMATRSDVVHANLMPKREPNVNQSNLGSRKMSDSAVVARKGSDTTPTSYASAKMSETAQLKIESKKASVENVESKKIDDEAKATNEAKFKSILRKVSKYDAPMYHTAAVAARQKWVEHITATTSKTSSRTQSAKLADTQVKDSLEVNRNGSSRPKSVRWHEIHYDDGTSATLADSASMIRRIPPAPPTVNVVSRPFRSVAEKSLRNRVNSANRVKPKPPTFEVDKTKKPTKGGRGRKLKMPARLQVAMNPHPPVKTSYGTKTLNTTAEVTPSKKVGVTGGLQARLQEREPPQRIAWASDERSVVTMENLKSSGSPPPRTPSKEQSAAERSASQQVTSPSQHSDVEHDTSFNLSKTPTDQEINWLWDKVRTCISQRPDSRGVPISKTLSDTSTDRSAFASPYQSLTNGKSSPPRASVVSIDGGMFVNHDVQSRARRMVRPSSAVVASAKQRLNTYNASIRRQALLQQRRNKQFGPNRMKPDMVGAPRRYPTPRVSYFDPLPSPSGRPTGQVDESTTAFLLVETLAEQNMSEDQILRAMESLQKKTRDAQSHKAQVNPNSLSTEEQRLLKSLERLNMRLHEVETATATNPNMNFFNHTQGAYSDRPAHSKDIRHQRRSSARY